MCAGTLKSHSQRLFGNLQLPFWDRGDWKKLKIKIEGFAASLGDYAGVLDVKKRKMYTLHASLSPSRTIGDNLSVEFLTPRRSLPSDIAAFQEKLERSGSNVAIEINELLPSDRRKRYNLIQCLKNGLLSPAILATYSPGSNIGNIYWLWLTDATDMSSAIQSCHQVIEFIKSSIPAYHTRAMRKIMFDKFGLVSKNMNKAILWHFYRDLTGDKSEKEVDERVDLLFELEEPDFIYDLRSLNSSKQHYDVFWNKAKEFLEEDIGTAVDDRRHSGVVHVAKAISIRDFRQQVQERCPPDTPIPSDELIRLQFVPAHKSYKVHM